ncbi:cell division protein FtsZ [Vogesella sp. LIG4]|uniref:cell division protein FtsZ n=1 Tax=Vogesella sp. LIG4 TaxID=1192162 RepID=UPI00081FBB27|nr:cell division protein FtsZ [Vogesella sp. LIG4]SCK10872.1 cell division protein FtsZ [Vogesella sp. LIG4]
MSGMVFEVMQETANAAVIKVIGVGGGGCNAIDNMIDSKVSGVEFICANTDAQALQRNKSALKLQLGNNLTRGLGAGANPEVGRSAALEDRERIAEMLRGANMVFVTAGMGGGTGTGAAPVVAEVAKELGILTVGVVTRPFEHEGRRTRVAGDGIDLLKKHVDSLIVIPNEKLMAVLGEDVTMREAFRAADDVLKGAVAGISEVITCPGLINVDFADVRAVMGEMGLAMMGSAYASGIDRARVAAEQAVASPLLDNITLEGARGVLVNISTAPGCLKMSEYREIMSIIRQYADEDAQVKFGTAEVEDMPEDTIRVTLIATGLGQKPQSGRTERPDYIKVLKTGTDNVAMEVNYADLEAPAVIRGGRNRRAPMSADFSDPEVSESYDIPAFLRKQAD